MRFLTGSCRPQRNPPAHAGFWLLWRCSWSSWLSGGFLPAFCLLFALLARALFPCRLLVLCLCYSKQESPSGLLGQAAWPQKWVASDNNCFTTAPQPGHQLLPRPSERYNGCTENNGWLLLSPCMYVPDLKRFPTLKLCILLSVHCSRLVSSGKSSSFLRSLPWDWAVLLCLWVLDLACVNSGHKRYSFVVKFWSTRHDLALLLPTAHFVGASVGENCFYITWSSVRFLLGFFPFFCHRFMCHYMAYTLLQCLLWLTLPSWQLQTRPLSQRTSLHSFFLHAPPYTFCLVAFWGQSLHLGTQFPGRVLVLSLFV